MSKLIIVESPAKAKTIEKYLGKSFKVLSSKGHIRDLSTTGKGGLGIDIENHFTPKYVVDKNKKATVAELKKAVKNAEEVFLASDPDREGEAIAWHLASELDLDTNVENRIVFNEITKKAVQNAMTNPRKIDMSLVHSQEARRMLDRIIGFKLSNLLRSKIKSKSAGRVQSVALALIVEKEEEINRFIPEEYWNIELDVQKQFKAKLVKFQGKKAKITNEAQAQMIVAHCDGPFTVSKVEKKMRKKESKLPFITSSLQQEAATKLNFSAKKTMQVAQKLYEGIQIDTGIEGLITYMRTDSYRLSNDFVGETFAYIENTFGKQYVGTVKKVKQDNAQDAHEAIRVSSIARTPESIQSFLTNDEFKLYRLIYARTLASLMSHAKFNATTITIINHEAEFNANGQTLMFDGYLKAYGIFEKTSDERLPDLQENTVLENVEIISSQHFSEPPLRYSEARLIKALEELGIGRPSTYATIVSTLQLRDYVKLEKSSETSKSKVFFPTEKGILTNTQLQQFFQSIINVKYTAQLESKLDEIALGELDHVHELSVFYEKFSKLLEHAYEKMEKKQLEKVNERCPKCGNELVYREGRFGKFISCITYPECDYTRNETPEKILEEKCPLCQHDLVVKRGRFGEFIGCSHYPDCNYMKPMKEKKEVQKTGKSCPKCGKELVIRTSRYNTPFLACSGFPKCRYVSKITEEE